jgi:uncharacterized sulfatase
VKLNLKLKKSFYLNSFLFLSIFAIIIIKNVLLVSFISDKAYINPMLHINSAVEIIFKDEKFRLFYYIGFLLILMAPIFLFKKNFRIIAFIILDFVVSLLFMIDIWYLRGFNVFPTLYAFQAIGNMAGDSKGIFFVLQKVDILFIIDIPLFIIALVIGIRYKAFKEIKPQPITALAIMLVAIIFIAVVAPVVNDLDNKMSREKIFNKYNSRKMVYNISALGHAMYSSMLFLENHTSLTTKEKKDISLWYKNKTEKLNDNQYKGVLKGKNLLLLQIESLENFVIDKKVDGQDITPTLNRLKNNSFYFSNIHEQVNQGNSSDADLIINTSIYPVRNGSTFYEYPCNKYNSMPDVLKKYGYFSSAFHPDKGFFWNWLIALQSMNFDKCYDESAYKIKERTYMGITDGCFFPQVGKYIIKQKEPFYSFVVTTTSHAPFEDIPKHDNKLNIPGYLNKTKLGGYLKSIHYVDEQIGKFLNKLEEDGKLKNTVVVIYGDHEGVHKYFKDDVLKIKPQESWFKNDTKIPLIVYNESINGEEIKTIGGQVDIYPTLMYLLGIDKNYYERTCIGRNLLNTNKNFVVLKDGGIIGKISAKEKEMARKGLDISDKIIRSNYFKH